MKHAALYLASGVISGLAAFSLSTAARAEPAKPDALDRFDRTGEVVQCINMRSVQVTPIDDRTLLFKSGSTYYVNETRERCNAIDATFTRIELRLFSNRACSGEIVKVVHQMNSTFVGACSLGGFEKLAEKKAE